MTPDIPWYAGPLTIYCCYRAMNDFRRSYRIFRSWYVSRRSARKSPLTDVQVLRNLNRDLHMENMKLMNDLSKTQMYLRIAVGSATMDSAVVVAATQKDSPRPSAVSSSASGEFLITNHSYVKYSDSHDYGLCVGWDWERHRPCGKKRVLHAS